MNSTRPVSGMNAFMSYWKSTMEQSREDFRDLSTALKSGDLATAKSAFAGLQVMFPNAVALAPRPDADGDGGYDKRANVATASAKEAPTDPRAIVRADVDALGAALQSGDLTAARDAFTQLTQDMKAIRGGNRGHHYHYGWDKGSRGVAATPQGQDPISLPAAPAPANSVASRVEDTPTFFGIDLKA